MLTTRQWWWWIAIILAGSGLAESGYLLARLFASFAPDRAGPIDLCSTLFSANCDSALADERFWILNVPLAGWGLVYFGSLAAFLLLGRFIGKAFEADALLAGLLLGVAGTSVGLALTATALLERTSICPMCVVVHATSLLLVVSLLKTSAHAVPEQLRRLQNAWHWLIRPGSEASEASRWKVVGLTSVALIAVVAYQWVYVETALRRPRTGPPPDRAAVIASFSESPRVELPLTEEDPHVGSLTAPVQLVVFGSFRCPACRRLARALPALERRFRDRLVVAYKHYPLSTECNASLKRDMQPGACEMAWAAEAAHRQARFWLFHNALFATGTAQFAEKVPELVRRLHLDSARFNSDRDSDYTRERVAADIALGNRLKIPGTPAVFLDGRLVPSRADVLEILIRYAIDHDSQGRARAIAPAMDTGRSGDDDRSSEGG